MGWIFDHFWLIVFLIVVITVVRKARAIVKNAEEDAARRGSTPRRMANIDPDEAERVRRIQEEIRRKIAERRGGATPQTMSAPAAEERPPLLRPASAPPIDPFGGPLKRMLTELERRTQARGDSPPAATTLAQDREAEQLAKQRELAKQYTALEQARQETRRTHQAETKLHYADAVSPAVASKVARGELMADLRDPRGLRRAFVLKEVLSTPVGLR